MVDQLDIQDPARHETVVAEGVSFEDFLTRYSEQHAEWLMGKVILIVTNNTIHDRIQTLLVTLLNLFVSFRGLGRVLSAGVPMYISEDQPAREPDIMVVLSQNKDQIKQNRLQGPADIAVEIVSPESSKRDHGDKLDEYEAAGVREYWLFDPLRQQTSIYEFGADSRYRQRPLDEQGRITSGVLPGFVLDPTLLWQDDLPEGDALIALVQQMLEKPETS